jgi:TolB-like protein/DNA-binding winged helix-turn-helix (wHTH) protein/tetratricopeptide (TPR) repeat protein
VQREPQAGLSPAQRLAWPGFVLDLARGELLDADGAPAELRAQALKVLLLLGERAGQVVGKDELMRRVWGEVVVTEDSLVQAVGDIRRVLGDTRHERVRTVPRRGYLLTLPSAAALPATLPAAPAQATASRRPGGPAALGVACLLLAVALAGVLAVRGGGAGPPASLRSLAILPFESAEVSANDAWFVDALTGDVTTKAARWSGVFVIGAGTMRGYKGKDIDPRQVARELGVQYVLTGRVRRDGERVRIDVALIDGANGRAAWSDQIDVPRAELPRSVGDIAGGVMRVLWMEWGQAIGERIATLSPAEAEADDLAMRAFAIHLRSLGPDNLEQARELFEQALAKDGRSLRALAGVSLVNSMNISFGWTKDAEASERRSQEALDRMETIDNHAHLTLLARASLSNARGDWQAQYAAGEALIRGWPNEPTSHHHRCSSLLRLGRFDEAIPACDRALKISPRDSRAPTWHGLAGMNEFMRGRYAAAAERARLQVTGNPKVPFYSLLLAAALIEDGRGDEAQRAIEDLRARHPGFGAARAKALWPVARAHPQFAAGLERIGARAREFGVD